MNLTTVVGTCDSYLDLIPGFSILYERYFEPNIETLIVSETENLDISKYKFITPGKKQWGERIINALSETKTEYVFFVLDDYYLSQLLTTEYIEYLLKFMDNRKVNKIMLSPVPDFAKYEYLESINTMHKMSPTSPWLTSVQPAIWRKSELLKFLKPEYTPWNFEVEGSKEAKNNIENYFVAKLDNPIYFNMVRKGKQPSPGWEEFLKEQNLTQYI
jgi:hypothetical protein